jgi:hypothetical protein
MQTLTPNSLPDYHFLFIASGLGSEWLFDAARTYFDRFRPTVVTDFSLIQLIPPDYSIAVTLIARRDAVASLSVQLAQLRPDALADPIVFDTAAEAKVYLDERAALSQPFGVPLPTQPTPGGTLLPSIPTPLVPVQGVEGWVTVTPAPPTATPTPAGTPLPPGDAIDPIEPTPGSLIGG